VGESSLSSGDAGDLVRWVRHLAPGLSQARVKMADPQPVIAIATATGHAVRQYPTLMESPPKLSFVCPMPWREMTGHDRRKFCSECGHHVQNLSLLTRDERLSLLERARTERICGAYFVRISGEMVTPERPLTSREHAGLRQLTANALATGVLALAAGCASPSSRDANTMPPAVPATAQSEANDVPQMDNSTRDEDTLVLVAMGMIICEPPKPPTNAPPSKRY
jgi:hypothetical protein